jgi:molybdenum cofactor cytidylyltransferase/nicotine blue oxidoreductase
MSVLAGAVLAAGSGTRMGRPKAELVVDGSRLLDRAVAALRDGGCAPVLAVVRADTPVAGALPVVNPDPSRGMRSSLELAIEAARDCDALAVVLVDVPGVDSRAIAAVTRAWRPGRIAVGRYGTRRGHPTVMAPDLWREALALAGPDEGARALLSARADLVDEVAVAGDGSTDLDTPADLAAWRSR